jgi:ribonucleoside-diphosphate reductase alpha chain
MQIEVVKRNGTTEPLSIEKIHKVVEWACADLNVSQSELETEAHLLLFNGIKTSDIHQALIKAAATLISVEQPQYTFVAARLLVQTVYKEAVNSTEYPTLRSYLEYANKIGRINPELLNFDLEELDFHIDKTRDLQFTYLGLQSLADRYFIREDGEVGKKGRIIEMPQHMFMRVAMGLSLNEADRTKSAIEFYDLLSSFDFMSSTPTLFNAGTKHSQLSSCYLNMVSDSIDSDNLTDENYGTERFNSIFGTIQECANLSKFAGGIGTDWTSVRSEGDHIKSTNGKSSGIVPYLKVFNDTAIAVNQGGKRNGAFAAYLEPWHPDLFDFIDLKKNSGDERRRAHDIFPALWMNDLLLERVEEGGIWSFFSPAEFPELHELHGEPFKARYQTLEAGGHARKQMPAIEVWRKILTSLFETGHPWITFKDECNRRNPQSHAGVIHCSNLCTEITLNTSKDETAVCNLGSVNLSRIKSFEHLRSVVRVAMRMLDNVIDINFYPSERARLSNMRHRPVGMGVMGYTEWLVKQGIDWESDRHLEAADELFEHWSYYAIEASSDLAVERGSYSSFEGSKWSHGILPIHTARTDKFVTRLDWEGLSQKVKTQGMRNSNTMAIAPTATISNIVGTTPCIEPIYKRQYTKTNLSGSFVVVDPTLSYGRPELCKEAFEIDQSWLIKAAAIRQKWIDQAQSTNLFVKAGIRGSQLADLYMMAWKLGLKTTYYLRNQSQETGSVIKQEITEKEPEVKMCSIDNPDCESCQ